VSSAREAGFDDVSDRMVTEWGRLGLLDIGERVGRKDGRRGAFYTWPDNQYHLFVTLLGKRGDVRHTKALVVIPVGIWLYWGDEWVPLRQVRRALLTSVELYGPPASWERAEANAREVVASLRRDGAPGEEVARLHRTLALGLHNGKLDPRNLRPLVAQVLRSDGRIGGWGPFGWDVNQVVDMLRATTLGVKRIATATDEDLIDARDRLRTAILDYSVSWRRLQELPGYGSTFERPTIDMVIERSCRDLATQLGMQALAEEEGRALPRVVVDDWRYPPLPLLPLRTTLDHP